VREIAAHLEIAEGTVKAMLFRARQSLAVTLGDDEPTGEEPAGDETEDEREEVDRAHG
jgi:hypothetical protein